METRREIIIKANQEFWNQCLDSYVYVDYDKLYLNKNIHEKLRKSCYHDNSFEEDIQIEDSYTLTKFVMCEKHLNNNARWSKKFLSNQNKEKNYKIIKKQSENGDVRFVKFDTQKSYLWIDLEKLQKELELKKYDVLSDGDDLGQVIKYYSNYYNCK